MPSPTKVQLIGGHFQDAEGNVLALGALVLELSQDEQITSLTGQITAGIKIRLALDSAGSVSTSPAQSVWPTDVMNPSGATYTAWCYAANGQLAWGPNYGLTVPSGATYDVDNWVPNSTSGSSGGAAVGSILLQTNSVNNGNQGKFNAIAGTGMTITDDGLGDITFTSSAAPTGPRPSLARWNYVNYNAGGTPDGPSGVGMSMQSFKSGSVVLTAPTATEGPKMTYTGATTNGCTLYDQAGVPYLVGTTLNLAVLGFWETSYGMYSHSATSPSCFIGLTDISSVNGGAMVSSGLRAAADFIGFRYSPSLTSDVNWIAYVQKASLSPTTVNTGVVPDATGKLHVFAIQPSGANILFFIDGTQVASIPASSAVSNTTGLFSQSTVSYDSSTDPAMHMSAGYFYYETLL